MINNYIFILILKNNLYKKIMHYSHIDLRKK